MKEIPINFKVNEEEHIVGVFHFPDKEKFPILIICHGFGSDKYGPNRFFVKIARELSKNGYGVLRFDFRGCGDSSREFHEQTLSTMLEDLDVAISECIKIPNFDGKLGIIAHSLAARISLIKASQNEKISFLILLTPRISDPEDFYPKVVFEELERIGYIRKVIGRKIYKIEKEKIEEDKKYKISEIVKKIKIPVKIICGELDEVTPPSEGLKLKNMLKEKCEVKILENLDHYFSSDNSRREVIRIILELLEELKR